VPRARGAAPEGYGQPALARDHRAGALFRSAGAALPAADATPCRRPRQSKTVNTSRPSRPHAHNCPSRDLRRRAPPACSRARTSNTIAPAWRAATAGAFTAATRRGRQHPRQTKKVVRTVGGAGHPLECERLPVSPHEPHAAPVKSSCAKDCSAARLGPLVAGLHADTLPEGDPAETRDRASAPDSRVRNEPPRTGRDWRLVSREGQPWIRFESRDLNGDVELRTWHRVEGGDVPRCLPAGIQCVREFRNQPVPAIQR
jgi:hypothetical protein